MTYWKNKQNLNNAKLFKEEDLIESISTSWSEPYTIDVRSDRLNRRVSKLSPRRHKATSLEQELQAFMESLEDVNS